MIGARRKIATISAAATVTLALMTFGQATTSGASGAVDPDCGPSPSATYTTCLFHDSFSGGEDGVTLNDTNWKKAKNVRLASGACLKEDYVTVGGGTLNLRSEVLATAAKCTPLSLSPASRFVGGLVTTDGQYAHTYGRIEFKAALPSSNTFNHTALWMNPDRLTYGKWPKSGEIDIMERFAPPVNLDPNTVHQTIHYLGGPTNDNEHGTCTVSSPEAFHLYSVEWSPSRMKFYIDNQLCNDFGWTPTNVDPPKPFDKPFNMIATQVSGGDASTPAGNERITKIDWVKFWG